MPFSHRTSRRAASALAIALGSCLYAPWAVARSASTGSLDAAPATSGISPSLEFDGYGIEKVSERGPKDLTSEATLHPSATAVSKPHKQSVRAGRMAVLAANPDEQSRSGTAAGDTIDPAACSDLRAGCDAEPPTRRESPTARYGWNGELSAGAAYESDPANSVSHVFDNPAIGAARRGGGVAFVGAARLQGRTTVGFGWVYGGASLVTKNSLTGPQANYQVGEARAGFGRRVGRGVVTLGGVFRHGRFADAPYLTQYGGQAGVIFAPGKLGRLAVQMEAVRQDYARTTPTLSRDGWRFDLATTLLVNTGSKASVVVGFGLEKKTALTRTEGYRGARLLADVRAPIGVNGTYLKLTSTMRYSDYDDNGSIRGRTELRFFNRAAIGIPVGPKGLVVETAISHTALNYNRASQLNDYSSIGGEVRLVWKFGR